MYVVGNKYFDPQGIFYYPFTQSFFILSICMVITYLYLIVELVFIIKSNKKREEISKHLYINLLILILPFILFGFDGFTY